MFNGCFKVLRIPRRLHPQVLLYVLRPDGGALMNVGCVGLLFSPQTQCYTVRRNRMDPLRPIVIVSIFHALFRVETCRSAVPSYLDRAFGFPPALWFV